MSTPTLPSSPVLSDFVPTNLPFVKLEGLGNDFVLFNDFYDGFSALKPNTQKALIKAICDRRAGVGADQVIFLDHKNHTAENEADIHFFNADGEEAGACGNGTRCAALQVAKRSHLTRITLHAPRRTLSASIALHNEDFTSGFISVNMGKPLFSWENIPLSQSLSTEQLTVEVDDTVITGSACSMGNPHFTVFCDSEKDLKNKASTIGPLIEKNPIFKDGCNVTFCHVNAPNAITAHVWERGSGITLACGTGACATFANARRRGLVEESCEIKMPGGVLSLTEEKDGSLKMSGNANEAFQGSLTPADLLLRHTA